jgi:putative DNA primase/helicase
MGTTSDDNELAQPVGERRAVGESISDSASDVAGKSEKQRARPNGKNRTSRVVTQEREDLEEGNSIQPARQRSRRARTDSTVLVGQPSVPSDNTNISDRSSAEAAQSASDKVETDPWTVPASVLDRFTHDGNRFYFPDGHPAFRDYGRRLSTASENTEVVHSLIEIANARGWREITVEGTERFRQEAWRQGKLAGLQVRGYKPAEAERASLIRALARNREDAVEPAPASSSTSAPEASASVARATAAASSAPDSKRRDELIVGELVDFGRESYRFDPHEEMSYFVQVQTREGKRTIWGQDLQRALSKSLTQPQIGDEIAMRRTGSEAVTVNRRNRNADGEVLNERPMDAQRHRWVVEKSEFFGARSAAAQVVRDQTIDSREAVKRHPELAGTYLQLRAAELAAHNLRDPQDRKRFASLVRGALADTVARGGPLQPVRLRERQPAERLTPRHVREPAEAAARG